MKTQFFDTSTQISIPPSVQGASQHLSFWSVKDLGLLTAPSIEHTCIGVTVALTQREQS